MDTYEITEDKIIEKFAINRLLDYVLEAMENAGRQEDEEVQN